MMEFYELKNLDNGDMLLEKCIIDNTNYTIINKNNGDKILKKISTINIISVNDIKKYEFGGSNILSCTLNNNKMTKLKYKSLLEKIYKIIDNGTKIIKNSKLNIKTTKKTDEGFKYYEDLGISIQAVDSNKSLLEIVNQCIENKISIIMKIRLNDKTNIDIIF